MKEDWAVTWKKKRGWLVKEEMVISEEKYVEKWMKNRKVMEGDEWRKWDRLTRDEGRLLWVWLEVKHAMQGLHKERSF